MKLGLLSAILPEKTFEEVIDIANEEGFKAVEICCWPYGKSNRRYAGVTHIDVDTLTDEKAKYYLEYAANKDVEIMALGYYPNPLDQDLQKALFYQEHIKKVIKASHKLGINRISTFIGKNQYLTDEDNFLLFRKYWPNIIELAESLKVQVAIENCPMYFTKDEWPGGQNLASSPYNWKKMFEIIKSDYFGLCYDPSHLHLQGMDYLKPIYDFGNKIFHIHYKDIQVDQDKLDEYGIFTHPLNYMSPKIPGKGGINWQKFIEALKTVNYDKCGCIEIEDKDYEENDETVLKAIKDSYIHINNFL